MNTFWVSDVMIFAKIATAGKKSKMEMCLKTIYQILEASSKNILLSGFINERLTKEMLDKMLDELNNFLGEGVN